MARKPIAGEKPVAWVGSSKEDFLLFPEPVKDEMGNALGVAQFGGKHPSAKPWKGEGPGVFELVESHEGNAYRAVYTVKFRQTIYVLHAFQKKSKRGIKTALGDVQLVARRLKSARQDYEAQFMAKRRERDAEKIIHGSGNVFADLGLPDAEERQTKLRLAFAINQIIEQRDVPQSEAADILGINQPKISALLNYKLTGFSVERLMTLLTALDRDVEIHIRKKSSRRATGRITVVAA